MLANTKKQNKISNKNLIFVDDDEFRQRVLDWHRLAIPHHSSKLDHALHPEKEKIRLYFWLVKIY